MLISARGHIDLRESTCMRAFESSIRDLLLKLSLEVMAKSSFLDRLASRVVEARPGQPGPPVRGQGAHRPDAPNARLAAKQGRRPLNHANMADDPAAVAFVHANPQVLGIVFVEQLRVFGEHAGMKHGVGQFAERGELVGSDGARSLQSFLRAGLQSGIPGAGVGSNTSQTGTGNGNVVLGTSGLVIGNGGTNGNIYLKKRLQQQLQQ